MINCYVVKVSGKYINGFIRRLLKSNIDIWDLKYYDDYILLKVSYNDYLKVKKIKTSLDVSIIEVKGIKKLKIIFNKYNVFFVFLILSFFIVFILSKMTFFININSTSEVNHLILKELNKKGITLYSIDKSFDFYKKVASDIKSNNKELIEWIEIVNKGLSLDVNVILRKNDSNVKEEGITNIVAEKNGIIKNIIATDGQLVKNNLDYVNKGDVIVSGIIRRNDNVVGLVNANAKVYAEVWYRVNVNHSYKVAISKIKEKRRYYYLLVNGKKIKLFSYNKNIDSNNTNYIYKGSFVSLVREDKIIKEKYDISYGKNDLKKFLEEEARKKILKDLGENEMILEQKTLKTYDKDGRMYVEVFFKTYEDIAKEVEVLEDDINLNAETEG